MKFLTQRTLKVFAVLEQIRNGSQDILEGLMPFFAPLLREMEGALFDPTTFSESVTKAYGWNFGSDVVEELSPRFLQKGWLASIAGNADGQLYRVLHIPDMDVATAPQSVGDKLSEIADNFMEFLRDLSPLSQFSITKEEFSDILVEWLVSIDAYNEQVLQKSAIAKITEGRISLYQELPDGTNLKSEEKYLCARYVRHLFDIKSPYTDDLCNIAAVGLLTEVVRDFQKPVTSVVRSELAIYLDSSVALELLGVSGRRAFENVERVVTGAQAIGCSVRVFEMTLSEMRRALEAVLRRPVSNRTGPTADALRKNEVLEAYVREVARDPRPFLEAKGIGVTPRTLSQFPNEVEYFNNNQYEAFTSQISWHHEVAPKEHDAKAVTFIMRMRKATASRDIFNSRNVFVTRNGMLAQLARRFCRIEGIATEALPPVIHQRQLAAALWLRTGNGLSSSEIPRHLLLAACEQVLSINRAVVERAQHQAKSLTKETAEQLDLLLSQDRSVQLLQDKTLNSSRVVTSENIEELIGLMRMEVAADIKAESEAKVDAEKKAASLRVREAGKRRTAAEAALETAKSELGGLVAEDREIVLALLSEVNRKAEVERWAVVGCVTAVTLFACSFGFVSGGVTSPTKELLVVVAIGVTAFSTLLTFFGRDLGLRTLFERRARSLLQRASGRRNLSNKLKRFQVTWVADTKKLELAEVQQPGTREGLSLSDLVPPGN